MQHRAGGAEWLICSSLPERLRPQTTKLGVGSMSFPAPQGVTPRLFQPSSFPVSLHCPAPLGLPSHVCPPLLLLPSLPQASTEQRSPCPSLLPCLGSISHQYPTLRRNMLLLVPPASPRTALSPLGFWHILAILSGPCFSSSKDSATHWLAPCLTGHSYFLGLFLAWLFIFFLFPLSTPSSSLVLVF